MITGSAHFRSEVAAFRAERAITRAGRRQGAGARRRRLGRVRVTVLVGGVGGARFLLGVKALPDVDVTAVVNVGDDIWLHGLRICPDLDTCMYTLGGGIDTERGWGRAEETLGRRATSWPPTAPTPTGSASATATPPPTSSAPGCSARATRSRTSPRRCATAGSPA